MSATSETDKSAVRFVLAFDLEPRGFWDRGYAFDYRNGDIQFAELARPEEPFVAWGRRAGQWVRLGTDANGRLTPEFQLDSFEALRDDVIAEADQIMSEPRLSKLQRAPQNGSISLRSRTA